jgi:hypothetical protein
MVVVDPGAVAIQTAQPRLYIRPDMCPQSVAVEDQRNPRKQSITKRVTGCEVVLWSMSAIGVKVDNLLSFLQSCELPHG